MKRGFDILLTVATAPLWLAAAAVAAAASRLLQGPGVLHFDVRAGRGGRPFRLAKFRSMRPGDAPDAERITRFGRFLRASSLDELPQLWNVLKGDMSLVGPRPLPVRYLPRYSPEQMRRHEVRPGITGLAQVCGRNALDWDEKLRLDVEYVDRRSFALDLKILFLTAFKVLKPSGISHAGNATMPEFTGSSRAAAALAAAAAVMAATIAFAAPPQKPKSEDRSLGEFSREIRRRVSEKVASALETGRTPHVTGVVTFSAPDRFFIQRDSDGLKIAPGPRTKRPRPGDTVTVAGQPSLEGGHVVFVCKSWKKEDSEPLPAPVPASGLDLAGESGKPPVHALRVVAEGRAMGPTETGFAMTVDGVPVNVLAQSLPPFAADCDKTRPKVRVTGVAEQILDESVLAGRPGYVMGVKINVSSADDIALVPDLEYLTAKRHALFRVLTWSLSGILCVVLAASAALLLRQQRRLLRSRTIMAERRRMADDIHDTVEQHLVGAGMLMRLGRLKEAQDALLRAKKEVREVVWGLKNDDMMRLSPADMLRRLAHEETVKGLCRVDTRVGAGMPAAADAAWMRDLSLIVREAVGNAVKHGGAKKIAITSDPAEPPDGWLLRIANDGTPFDPDSAPGPQEDHFGIEGMRRRARRIGASVSFSTRSGWTVVSVSFAPRGAGKAKA